MDNIRKIIDIVELDGAAVHSLRDRTVISLYATETGNITFELFHGFFGQKYLKIGNNTIKATKSELKELQLAALASAARKSEREELENNTQIDECIEFHHRNSWAKKYK